MDPSDSNKTYLDSEALSKVPDHTIDNGVFDHIPVPNQLIEVNAAAINRFREVCEPANPAFYHSAVTKMINGIDIEYLRYLNSSDIARIYANYSTNPARVYDLSAGLLMVSQYRDRAYDEFCAAFHSMGEEMEYTEFMGLAVFVDIIFHCSDLIQRILVAKCTGWFTAARLYRHDNVILGYMSRNSAHLEVDIYFTEKEVDDSLSGMRRRGIKNGNRSL